MYIDGSEAMFFRFLFCLEDDKRRNFYPYMLHYQVSIRSHWNKALL